MSPGRVHLAALNELTPAQLEPALGEASEAWQRRLHWDFRATAELIRGYVAMRALDGLALIAGDELAGYCYWVHEAGKTLLGDLFVRERWRTAAMENMLLGAVVAGARHSTLPGLGARRIEAQLMQLATRASALLPDGPRPRAFPRFFMLRPQTREPLPRLRGLPQDLDFSPWNMSGKADAARLITTAYQGHVDSEINDQYHSVEGSARFLQNIVQYPGCGVFQPAASWLARDAAGRAAGLSLATQVAGRTGHIAQLCVQDEWRGSGLAYELLRRSLQRLHEAGMDEVSLTVTGENTRAVALYEKTGFHPIHRFDALVWDEAA